MTRDVGQTLNVLSFPTHERYSQTMSKVNAKFYLWQGQGIKDWKECYAKLPANHVLLDPTLGDAQLPQDVSFDCILSQNKFAHYNISAQLSRIMHVPLISLEHCLPVHTLHPQQLQQLYNMKGHLNLFISEFSRKAWGWKEDEAEVVHHGIDTDLFSPAIGVERKSHLLSVVNDWINRDYFCGFNLWTQISNELPVMVVGDTPGLSKPAASTEELVKQYQSSRVFLNTSLVSPVPTSLMEAMSCGCACVSTATCMIPEIITNGVNGYISNDPQELRHYCQRLLKDEALARHLGENARKTIVERFNMDQFVKRWDSILASASNIIYRG